MEPFAHRRPIRRDVLSLATGGGVTGATADGAGGGVRLDGGPTVDQLDEPEASGLLRFPERFSWGAATSAYQIEGATTEDGRGPSIWDTFSRTPGRVRNGDTGDVAADHYHRYLADLDLMKSLGLQSYRFSVAWTRIQPDGRGPANQRGVDFYRRLVDGLLERGISPMVTLFHWDLPQRLQDAGGWENRDCAYWFAEYADIMFRALDGTVPVWLTVNEPKTVVLNGYTTGHHAPGKQDVPASYVVAHHLLLAHGLAVQAFRDTVNEPGGISRIGPALNLAPSYPVDDSALEASAIADAVENRLYLDPIFRGSYPADLMATFPADAPVHAAIRDGDLDIISSDVDILAVQYYNPVHVTASGQYIQKYPTSQAFWQEIYPQGMYDTLTRIRRDYGDIPITITENGIPRSDCLGPDGNVEDPDRITFLRDHLAAAHQAIGDGVNLESYHVWSLLDNFEWECGYGERWGIVYIDYETQRRVPKASARWYRDVISRNGLA